MGMEQFDYLYLKSQEMRISLNAAKTAVGTNDAVTANTNIDKCIAIVDELDPMITAEMEKAIGDGTKYYKYICRACSIHCPEKYRFKPSEKNLKICRLKDDKSANFVEDGTETIK
jgi:hypothetical protein